jgi:predicted Zn-dependent peptidase
MEGYMIKRSLAFRAALLLLWLGLATGNLYGFDFSAIEGKISDFTLDNGMKFIVMKDHSAPVVSFVILADVGSVDDPKQYTGLAHYCEHMAFKGTDEIGTKDYKKEKKTLEKLDAIYLEMRAEEKKGVLADSARLAELKETFEAAQEEAEKYVEVNEFGQIVETEGGINLNAGTSYDYTMYVYSFPSNKLELWFALESSRFSKPVLRQFYKEMGPIKEERRMGLESSPVGRLIEEFFAAAFVAHPYGIEIIGHMSDIHNMNPEAAMEFYSKYYVASNLIAAIVGDVDPEQIRELAEKYFGKLPRVPEPERIATVEPEQNAERRVVVFDKSQPFLVMGYHRPAITDSDDPVFDAIADYLGRGRTSLLYKKLVKEKKMAATTAAFAAIPGGKYPTLFGVFVIPSKDVTAEECEIEVLAEIERLKSEPIPEEELTKIKARAKASLVNNLANRSGFNGMPTQLAVYENSYGDWRKLFTSLDEINAITADDIQRVAKEYLTRNNRTVAYIETVEE